MIKLPGDNQEFDFADDFEFEAAKCDICHKRDFRYTCASCFVRYCSLACFKSEYHKDCKSGFDQREKLISATREGEDAKIYEILDRQKTSTNSDIEDEEEWTVELPGMPHQQVEESDDVDWTKLSSAQQLKFLKIIQKRPEILLQGFSLWKPWWIDGQKATVEITYELPEIPRSIVEIFARRTPDSRLIWFLPEIVVGYAYMCRTYNSDLCDIETPYEAVDAMKSISSYIFEKTIVFPESLTNSIETAVAKLTLNLTQGTYARNRRFISTLLEDAAIICSQWNSILKCLSFMHDFLRLEAQKKKILYFLAYMKYMSQLFDLADRNKDIVDHIVTIRESFNAETHTFLAQRQSIEDHRAKEVT